MPNAQETPTLAPHAFQDSLSIKTQKPASQQPNATTVKNPTAESAPTYAIKASTIMTPIVFSENAWKDTSQTPSEDVLEVQLLQPDNAKTTNSDRMEDALLNAALDSTQILSMESAPLALKTAPLASTTTSASTVSQDSKTLTETAFKQWPVEPTNFSMPGLA